MQCFDSLLRHRRKALGLLHKPRGNKENEKIWQNCSSYYVYLCTVIVFRRLESDGFAKYSERNAVEVKLVLGGVCFNGG